MVTWIQRCHKRVLSAPLYSKHLGGCKAEEHLRGEHVEGEGEDGIERPREQTPVHPTCKPRQCNIYTSGLQQAMPIQSNIYTSGLQATPHNTIYIHPACKPRQPNADQYILYIWPESHANAIHINIYIRPASHANTPNRDRHKQNNTYSTTFIKLWNI